MDFESRVANSNRLSLSVLFTESPNSVGSKAPSEGFTSASIDIYDTKYEFILEYDYFDYNIIVFILNSHYF